MVIVHLAPFLQGGAGRAITLLASAQRAAGHDVLVATSLTPEPGFENYPEYLETLRHAGIELIEVDSLFKRDPILNAHAATVIRATLGTRRPAIVHAHAAIPARIGRLIVDAPVVQTMHGWSRNKSAAHVAEDLSIMRDVEAVIFPSAASLHELQAAGATFKRSAIVPYGMPTTERGPLPETLSDLAAIRARGTRIIVTIGSLTRQKNHAVVIEALPAIAARHDAMVVLVGEGPELAPLSKRADELGVGGRTRFCGYVSEAATALGAADLLIQPSLTESFGIAVIEAFREGVPVVASDIAALSELVADTNCGWTFDPNSAKELAAAVDAALSQPANERAALISRARTLFADRFSVDRMISGYFAIYEELV
jgi:glycosyltransferase involved in cell wall biosynthesis